MPRNAILAVLLLTACGALPVDEHPPPVATFSIVAYDEETGDLGVAVQSKFFGVGSVVPWAKADVGAVATQAWANTRYGPDGLRMLGEGLAPEAVIEKLTEEDPGRERRQLGIVDAKGRAAAFTGGKAMAWAGHIVGAGFACQGNILAGERVVRAMAKSYRESGAPLPERLVAALSAGQAAGGDKRGRQSAALLVVRRGGGYSGFNDRYVDLRVEDHETPIEELSRLLEMHRKFFPNVPVPGRRDVVLTMEPLPKEPTTATPRGAWEVWKATFKARDWPALLALHSEGYRAENPLEKFMAEMSTSAEGIGSFLESARYEGTEIEGDTARIHLRSSGSPRAVILSFIREEGGWRMSE